MVKLSQIDIFLYEFFNLEVSKIMLEKYPIQKVVIKIRKPHAPIHADFDTVEVEIERNK